MDLSLGFLFCWTDLYFCLCASTILSWWLWLCSIVWSQAGWFLQFHSSFQDYFGYLRYFGGMFWENSIETCILSRVKQITSPGWMHETSAWAWCTGKTQWGIGRGIHVYLWLIHVNVWQKPLQYCKVISLQLIKINEKKRGEGLLGTLNKHCKTMTLAHSLTPLQKLILTLET